MSLPIVLLHGFPFDGGMWGRQAAYLRGLGWRVLTPDLGGFGVPTQRRESAGEAESMEGYAEQVHALIRHSGGRAIVGGLSMGGYVLLALLRAHPADVAGVMLLDTRAEADSPEARANRLKSIEEVHAKGTGGLVEGMMGRLLAKGATEAVRAEVRGMMLRQSAAAVTGAQGAMARRRDQTELLAEIRVPTLVVVGSEDVVTPVSVAQGMAEKIAGSQRVVIEGSGHMTPLEAPLEVGAAMGEFVRQIERDEPRGE